MWFREFGLDPDLVAVTVNYSRSRSRVIVLDPDPVWFLYPVPATTILWFREFRTRALSLGRVTLVQRTSFFDQAFSAVTVSLRGRFFYPAVRGFLYPETVRRYLFGNCAPSSDSRLCVISLAQNNFSLRRIAVLRFTTDLLRQFLRFDFSLRCSFQLNYAFRLIVRFLSPTAFFYTWSKLVNRAS